MSRGGQNKTHASTSERSRIDRFYHIIRKYALAYAAESGRADVLIDDEHIRVSWVANRFDRPDSLPRMYWICPCCGRQVRFLYNNRDRLMCRQCARLNYPSQQATHNADTEERRMREALLLMGCYEAARLPVGILADLETPPPRPPEVRLREYRRGWIRFCKARERWEEYTLKWLLMAAGRLM